MADVSWPISTCAAAVVSFGMILWRFPQECRSLISRVCKAGPVQIAPLAAQLEARKIEVGRGNHVDPTSDLFKTETFAEAERVVRKALTESAPDDVQRQLDIAVTRLAHAQLVYRFRETALQIFGSQLTALCEINASNAGVDKARLQAIHQNTVSRYPEQLKEFSFENFVGFLESHQLIRCEGGRYFINGIGREFLTYLVQTGSTMPRLY